MDNTYFAVLSISKIDNWDNYAQYRSDIIQFIQTLQSYNSYEYSYGGFYNDNDAAFNSLCTTEPNLLASFYCIKSLEIFGVEDSINLDNFRQFLSVLYDPQTSRFKMPYSNYHENYTDIIATALGYELAIITGFTGFNRTETLNFLLSNHNEWGGWNATSFLINRELMDTYQVIRCLYNTGNINKLGQDNLIDLGNYIELFKSCSGYSLLSRDYTSLKNLWAISYSFYANDRISDLKLDYLYREIQKAYYYDTNIKGAAFYANIRLDPQMRTMRSLPIEYYTFSKHRRITSLNSIMSQEACFNALDALQKIYKLDDFGAKDRKSVV